MTYIRRFILMLQFMTRIPVNVQVKAEREDFGKGLAMAPAVGLVLGILLAAGNYLLGMLFPSTVTAVFSIALYVFLTGGLHLDGLGDTADGLFSNRPRERVLEIMKDSRVGTNAVLALMIIILLNGSLIASLESRAVIALLLMPVAGRVGSLIASATSRYAGTSDGPGRWCVECCGRRDLLLGLAVYGVIFLAAAGTGALLFATCPPLGTILVMMVIPPVSAYLLAKFFARKLDGVTGDILGAVCELNQLVFLIAFFLMTAGIS